MPVAMSREMFPECVGSPGIPTLTEGPLTVITFEDKDEVGLETGGGGTIPLPNIPMTIGKTFPSRVPFSCYLSMLFKSTQTRLTPKPNLSPYIGKILYPKNQRKLMTSVLSH